MKLLQTDIERAQSFNRKIFLFIFLFTLLSGAVRKWVVDSGVTNALITIVQVPILYLLLLTKPIRPNEKSSRHVLLSIYLLYLCFTAFNPIIPTFYHGIAGVIIHFGFWLGLFIYISNRPFFQTEKLEKPIVGLIILQAVLAMLQYQLPADSFLNRYAGGEAADDYFIAQVGTAVRVTGTFSYLSGFTGFILFFQLFTFASFIRNSSSVQFNLFTIIGMLMALMSGSRAAVFVYLIFFLSFSIFQVRISERKKIFTSLILLPFIAVLLSSTLIHSEQISSFIDNIISNFDSRLSDTDVESQNRILTPFFSMFNFNLPNILWGNGLGITYPAVNELFGVAEVVRNFGGQDDEVTRTIIEGGYLLLIFKFVLIYFAVSKLSLNKYFASIIFIIVFIYVPLSTNVYNAVFFLMGIMFLDMAVMNKAIHLQYDKSKPAY